MSLRKVINKLQKEVQCLKCTIAEGGGGSGPSDGVLSVTGDGVGGTAKNVILTFPKDLDEFTNTSVNPYVRESSLSLPTGLEKITNGANTGWRLIGRDASKYANIGQGAIDMSLSTIAGNGATGPNNIISGGLDNKSSGEEAVIAGGKTNIVTGSWSAILGGVLNKVITDVGTIAGGQSNEVTAVLGAIVGGGLNKASGSYSFIGGGLSNEVSNENAVVAGGTTNKASGLTSSVLGGNKNIASGDFSVALGGGDNISSGYASMVGGARNLASGDYAVSLAGNQNKARGYGSSIVGGAWLEATSYGEVATGTFNKIKTPFSALAIDVRDLAWSHGIGTGDDTPSRKNLVELYKDGRFLIPELTIAKINAETTGKILVTKEWVQEQGIDLSTGLEAIDEGNGIGWRLKGRNPNNYGNIGLNAIDLGASNSPSTTVGATGDYSTVGGGTDNEASGIRSTVGGGYGNVASGYNSTIGGGISNEASQNQSTVGGGNLNKASGYQSTVAGGYRSESSGTASTVGGGHQNIASGTYSTVSGGYQNLAKTFGEFLGGIWATIKEGNATTWIGTDRIFGIGNGTSELGRSDAFNVYKNGVAELPSVTNELIDLGSPKTIPTKEWVNSRNSIILVITPLGEVLEAGDVEYTFTAPYNFTLSNYWISAQVAPIGSGITVRLKVNGTYIDSTGTTIPTGIYNSLASLPTITTPAIVKGDRITAEITAVGSTYEGEGLTLYLES